MRGAWDDLPLHCPRLLLASENAAHLLLADPSKQHELLQSLASTNVQLYVESGIPGFHPEISARHLTYNELRIPGFHPEISPRVVITTMYLQ